MLSLFPKLCTLAVHLATCSYTQTFAINMLIFFSYIESLDTEVCEENNIEEDLDCLNSEENSTINPL